MGTPELTVEYCRKQAEACRAMSEASGDPIYQQALGFIARDWDELAARLIEDKGPIAKSK